MKINRVKISKLLSILAVILLPFFVIPAQKNENAYAITSSPQGTVIAVSLNVRETADISSKIVGLIHQGETYEIIQTKNNWDQIKLSNNQTGWVYNAYITPTENREATVDAIALNIREKPSMDGKVIGILKSGTKITVQAEHSGWAKMTSSTGFQGWVYASYITKAAPGGPKTQPETVGQPLTEAIPNSQPLKGKTIVLDPGHGGIDSGTTSIAGTPEKTLALEAAKTVEQKLENAGAYVIMTRTDDTFIPLQQRAAISNQNQADAFISFHYNWSDDPMINGLTGFYFNKSKDNELASDILNGVIQSTKLTNVGTRFEDLSVLRNNSQPSTLIELGFVSNQQDDSVVESTNYRENVAQGVYQGLLNYFSINK